MTEFLRGRRENDEKESLRGEIYGEASSENEEESPFRRCVREEIATIEEYIKTTNSFTRDGFGPQTNVRRCARCLKKLMKHSACPHITCGDVELSYRDLNKMKNKGFTSGCGLRMSFEPEHGNYDRRRPK